MREIKFRAWDGEKMIDTGVYHSIEKEGITTTEMWEGIYHEYLPLMQYTGLKDKNGVEIYEGDVVNTDSDKNMIVKIGGYWECPVTSVSGNGNGVHIHNKEENIVFGVSPFEQDNNLEVIGNIYANPELIK